MIKVINDEGKSTIWFGDLEIGDTFIYNGQLYIRSDETREVALNLSDEGVSEKFSIDTQVVPVDVEIKITRKVEF